MPYRKPADGSDLPEWKEELNATHRKIRARVEHTLARMKCWKILRDYRRAASTLGDTVPGSPTCTTSPSPTERNPVRDYKKISYKTSLSRTARRWIFDHPTVLAEFLADLDPLWIIRTVRPRSRPHLRSSIRRRPTVRNRCSAEDRGRGADRPWLPNSSSTARCVLVHSLNRRCAVGAATPNDGGSNRQEPPLASTNTIAVNTARSPTGVVPPPCGR